MERQTAEIAGWGSNVYVKIPVTNTRREPAYEPVRRLSASGVKVNVTALTTLPQVRAVADPVSGGARPASPSSPGASPIRAGTRSRSWPRPWTS